MLLFFSFLATTSIATWSGGNITTNAILTIAPIKANGAGVNITGSSNYISGNYNSIYTGAFWKFYEQTNTAPTINLIYPTSETVTNSTINNIIYYVTDSDGDLLNCTLYHSNTINPTIYETNNSINNINVTTQITSNDGTYYFKVNCSDGSTSTQSPIFNYTIDTTKPIVTLITPENNSLLLNNPIIFNYNISDIGEIQNCSLLINTTGTMQIIQTELLPTKNSTNNFQENLIEGTYLWEILCVDETGNTNIQNSKIFEINNLPPNTITNLLNISSTNYSITWTWTNPTNNDFEGNIIYLDGLNIINTTSQTYTANGFLGNTSHTIKINTYDTSNNINTTNITSTASTLKTILNQSSTIIILDPIQHTTTDKSNISLAYSVSNPNNINSCKYYLDNDLVKINTNISTTNINYDYISNVSDGPHILKIGCTTEYLKYDLSSITNFKIIDLSGFDIKTNLTNTSLNNVTNFTLEQNTIGKITFGGAIDLTNVIDIGKNIEITTRSIKVNSTALPTFNISATLEIYDVPYNNILIWKDGMICQTCQIISTNDQKLIFNVSGFSTYVITSTSSLNTWDSSDLETIYANETMSVFANYSDIILGNPLTGTCNITIYDTTWSTPTIMNYNSTTKLHTYTTTLTNDGQHPYNISCVTSTDGFDNLTVSDIIEISPIPTVTQSFASVNITQIESSAYNETHIVTGVEGTHGNTSQLMLNITIATDAWQGYYGNITTTLLLLDADRNTFYSWNTSLKTGQIFASRTDVITWATVDCATQNVLNTEDLTLEKNESERDSVNNTFSITTHPQFVVGTSLIKHCRSTLIPGDEIAGTNFWNIIIADDFGTGSAIYTGIINSSTPGFKNLDVDFELLVPVNGKTPNNIVPYYFFLELD
jgi:hypothetical protein